MLVVDQLNRESGQCSFQRLYMKRDTRLPTVVEWYYTYQDSSVATSHCQQEKPNKLHTASNIRHSIKNRSCVLHKHLPRYKLSVWKLFHFNSGELCSTSLMLIVSDKSFYNG